MTDPADIKRRIAGGRTQTFDFLAENAPTAQIEQTLLSLANTHGGIVVFGVVGKSIVGLEDAEKGVDRLLKAMLRITPPLIIPLPKAEEIDGKKVIITEIPSGMPHVYALDGTYLHREGKDVIPLTPTELRRLMIQRGEFSFETSIPLNSSMEDIDWTKAREYVKSLPGIGNNDIESVLMNRGCLTRQEDKLYPTAAGILLFGKNPQQFFPGAEITAVRFASETMGDTFNRQDIRGTLPEQIQRAETFLVDHLRKDVKLKETMAREERFEYPMEAARELVVNAVAHRDYTISGDGVRLYIFSNRMEVYSAGKLPGPVTVDNIKDERFSRNPILVQVLADMGFIERLGYGVDRVMELMRQQNLRTPEFQERRGGFQVVIYNEAALIPQKEAKQQLPKIDLIGTYGGQEVNPRQEIALNALTTSGTGRITNGDLKSLFPDVHPETIRRDLADLVQKDILRKMGQKRGSYYVLKQPEKSTEKQ